jgi:hypothetical protein
MSTVFAAFVVASAAFVVIMHLLSLLLCLLLDQVHHHPIFHHQAPSAIFVWQPLLAQKCLSHGGVHSNSAYSSSSGWNLHIEYVVNTARLLHAHWHLH